METPYRSQSFPPLRLSAARRLLEKMTVSLDIPTYEDLGEIHAQVQLSPGAPVSLIRLVEHGEGLLATCPLCHIRDDLPCTHAIAVLLVFREQHLESPSSPAPPDRPLPAPPFRTDTSEGRRLRDLPCHTLLLAGTRKNPYFVALTSRMSLMTHADFQLLEMTPRRHRPDFLEAELFSRAFEPVTGHTGEGKTIPGFRPKPGNPEALFRYLALPGIRILSARTKQAYRIETPSQLPAIRFKAQWENLVGHDLCLGGEILLDRSPRPLNEMLWIGFESVSVLCGNGSLVFLSRENAGPSNLRRLLEIAGEGRSLTRFEWPALLEPLLTEPEFRESFEFSPIGTFPRFEARSAWKAVLRIVGRPEGGFFLTPELRYGGHPSVPLFGPERHRLGDYLVVGDSAEPGPILIARDREKELLVRNVFEKVARISSPSESIPVDGEAVEDLLNRVVPELESQGFHIDKTGLHDGTILPGPVHVFIDVSGPSTHDLTLQGRLQTQMGLLPFPGRPPEGNSPLLTLSSGVSVLLEGAARDYYRELCQLFTLNDEGAGRASRYYVSMMHLLRPDLPIIPAPEIELETFAPTPLSEDFFSRLPELCSATLRPYQKEAISFLASLHREGLSGILADEMGLGKTLSVLGFLAYLRLEGLHPPGHRPPLVVLPASLLYNWAHEIQHFFPKFRVHLHAGTTRQARLKNMEEADLLLTTYGTLRNDPLLASGPPFSCLILDEAHTVKNPDSRTHQALKDLPAPLKIAVTGTPIENRVSDLWGLMNLLMPGLLGSRLQFERRFLRTQEMGPEMDRRISLLRNLVAPLILRRTKEMVLPDLPPKVEVDIWIDPSPEERDQYHRLRTQGRQELLSMDGSLHMAYLTLLLRLRQFACHPVLLSPETTPWTGRSSKFDLVCDKIQEGVSEGHKILLFSQFTRVLDLFEHALPPKGISFTRLDGSTPLEERKRRVDAFQSDDPNAPMVFLASLKAGGVGLTLTRADYVFHYDPWWNPQAESQASDRSHRIGQTKTVFVYRFLMRDTVEERVQALKEFKKDLFVRLMNANTDPSVEGSGLGQLSLEEMRALVDGDPGFYRSAPRSS